MSNHLIHQPDIIQLMEAYFTGLHHASSKMLSPIFHKNARYVNATEGDFMNYNVEDYFDIVDQRVSPLDLGETQTNRIISITFEQHSQMAFVHAEMSMFNKHYEDFLTLIKHHEKWQIMSKVFTHKKL